MLNKTLLNTQPEIYRDFAKSFKQHPLNNDIIINKNEMAVREALFNIIFTAPYERPYSTMGVGINRLLFEPIGVETTLLIHERISNSIKLYEPRCNLINLDVVPAPDQNSYDITITFSILNNPRTFSINMSLKRLR